MLKWITRKLLMSSYTELRYLRNNGRPAGGPPQSGQDLTIASLHPALAETTCLRRDLQAPDPAGDRLLLDLCQEDDHGAFLCLRCHVSHALERKARDLVAQFKPHTGLELHEIAGFALLDDGDRRRREPLSYASLRQQPSEEILPFTAQVICSYDPQRGAGLPHWAKFRLQSYKPLKDYLRDVHGLVLISDWALLKDSSPTRIRKAWAFLPTGSLTLEQAVALHDAYCRHYSHDRQEHRRRHARSGGYSPSPAFLQTIQPAIAPEVTAAQLRAMATAIRRLVSPGWQKQLAQAAGNDGEERALDPLEGVADPRGVSDADEQGDAPLEPIRRALERALAQHMPAVIAPAASDPKLLCLWRGYAEGLSTRAIAARCSCSQVFVSRQLRSAQHASAMALKAADELSRQSAFEAVAASPDGAERMVKALKNQLLASEQTEGQPLPTLKQWLQRHLPPS